MSNHFPPVRQCHDDERTENKPVLRLWARTPVFGVEILGFGLLQTAETQNATVRKSHASLHACVSVPGPVLPDGAWDPGSNSCT